jgi:hypothetical protein
MFNTLFLETTVYIITQSKTETRDYAMLFNRCTEGPCIVTVECHKVLLSLETEI